MDIELIKTQKGFYEIWTDGQFVKLIGWTVGEKQDVYKARAEKEFEQYVEQMKNIKSGGGKTIRKTQI